MKRRRVSRLPIRVRLVAGFSAAMLAVYIAAAIFVYWRVEYALDRGLSADLTHASSSLASLLPQHTGAADRSARAAGATWQVLDVDGRIVANGGPLGNRQLVGMQALSRVQRNRPVTLDVGDFLLGSDRALRLRIQTLGADQFLVVGVRRNHRDEALRELMAQLAIAGLGALAVSSVVGDRFARAALRPVENYRQRAAEIAGGATGVRLEVPDGPDDEVIRLGRTLNDMLEALERLTDQERRFVEDASHELRTPLTLMTSRIQLARRRRRSVKDLEAALDELAIDATRLTELADQLLLLGGADSAAGGQCDLAEAVRRAVSRRDDGVSLDADRAVPIRAAAFAAEQIAANLLINASLHGTPPVVASVDLVRASDDSHWGMLRVSDRGPGMNAATLRTATARFARDDGARSRPGAGLGLSVVEALVVAAGGELRICCGGHHARWGRHVAVECGHGPQMCVSVLMPAAGGLVPAEQSPGD